MGPLLEIVEVALGDHVVETDFGDGRFFLVRDEDDLERARGALAALGQLREQVGEHGDVAQAVGDAAAVERAVVADPQLEGIALPALGFLVRGDHVEMRADETNRPFAPAAHRQHQARPGLVSGRREALDLDEPAVDVGAERFHHQIGRQLLARDKAHVRGVLQLRRHGDETPQQVDETGLVEGEISH